MLRVIENGDFVSFNVLTVINGHPLSSYHDIELSQISHLVIPNKRLERVRDQTRDIRTSFGQHLNNIDELCKLTNLQEIHIIDNKIKSIPAQIGELINLRVLNLEQNEIESVPYSIGQLGNLRVLNLSNNKIDSVSVEIGKLKQLEELDLSNNELESINDSFADLENLKKLNLSYNKIESIPDLTDLHLEEYYIYDNPIVDQLPKKKRKTGGYRKKSTKNKCKPKRKNRRTKRKHLKSF
jgi:hypothetical protein